MTDELVVTQVGDAWTNDAKPGENYGPANRINLQSGSRRGWLLPSLPVIAGRTVVDAYLVGHSAGTDAQTLTVAAVAARWTPGRIKAGSNPVGSALPAVLSGAVSAAVPARTSGQTVTIPGLASMLQSVADGDEWFGLRLTTNAASVQKFFASNSGQPAWELHIVLSELVDQPTNLRPDGGSVTSASPILAWGSEDVGGDAGQQVASRVQVDTPVGDADPDAVSPDYDSGWQANLSQQWDLAGRRTLVGAGPHFFRVMTRDADMTESEWSDWAEFTVTAMPSLALDSPVGPFGDVTPRFLAHLSSGGVKSWKAMVTGSNRAVVRAESGMQSGDVDWQVPANGRDGRAVLRENDPGWGYIQVWPEGDWVEAVGSLPYRELWFPLEFGATLGVEPVTDLQVWQTAVGDPRLVWQFRRAEAPVAVQLRVDGVTVRRVEFEELTSFGGGLYEFRDRGEVSPLRPHTLGVVALEDGAAGSEPTTVTGRSHVVKGVVLLLDDGSEPIVLDGTSIGGFARTDYRATYTTAEGEEVDVFYGMPGRSINFEGTVGRHGDRSEADVWALLDRIDAAKNSRTRMARVVWGSQTAYGRLRDPDWTSHDDILPNNLLHVVRFNFVQTGP